MSDVACQYVAADGVTCPRAAEVGSFCSDHTPEARELFRQRLAEQDAKRCSYVDNAGRCGARAAEHGRCIRHSPEAIERKAREDEAHDAETTTARIEALRAHLEELELAKTAAEARARKLLADTEEQRAQNRTLERESRDLRAEHRRLKAEVHELQQKQAGLEGSQEKSVAASDAKAEALLLRAIELLSAAEITEQDRLLAEACTSAAHEHRLWRALKRRRHLRPTDGD